MDIYRKLIVLVIIIITSFILYQLLSQRRAINNKESLSEGLSPITLPKNTNDDPAAISEVQNMIANDGGPGISNYSLNTGLYLSQYVIKSSYNSAYSGNFMSLTALDYVVTRGCRFLDFEIYLQNKYPIIAVSTDPTGQVITSKNSLKLFDVLMHIATVYSPASRTSPNPTDPLFLQFRIKSQDSVIYDLVASVIHNTIGSAGNNLYIGPPITPYTLLTPLMGQVIIVIDQTVAPTYTSSDALLEYTNLVSGSTNLITNTYNAVLSQATTPLVLTPDRKNTTSINFQMVTPGVGYAANPPYTNFIQKYGVNIILMKFYQPDSNLKQYETFFDKNHAGIVSLANSLQYIQSNGTAFAESFATNSDSDSNISPQYTVNNENRIRETAMTDDTQYRGTLVNADLTIFTPSTLDLERYPATYVPFLRR